LPAFEFEFKLRHIPNQFAHVKVISEQKMESLRHTVMAVSYIYHFKLIMIPHF